MYFYGYYYNLGDKLSVTYKDGTVKQFTLKDDVVNEEYNFFTEDGEAIKGGVNYSDDQELNEWGIGKECYYIVEYGGAFAKVPVIVKENDVKSIELYLGGDWEQYEIACNEKLSWDGKTEDGFRVINGIVIHNADGSTDTIKYQRTWIDGGEESESYYEEGFYDEQGNEVYLDIGHKNMNTSGQWYVSYQGVSCEIPTYHRDASWKVAKKPTCSEEGIYKNMCMW